MNFPEFPGPRVSVEILFSVLGEMKLICWEALIYQ